MASEEGKTGRSEGGCGIGGERSKKDRSEMDHVFEKSPFICTAHAAYPITLR